LLAACGMCSPNASTSPAATRRHWSSRSVSLPRLVFPRRCIRARAAALGCRIRNIGWSHSARRCVRRGHARRVTGGQLCGSIARAGPPSPRGRTIVSWSLCDAHRACIRVGPTTAYRRSRRRVGAARPALTMMAPFRAPAIPYPPAVWEACVSGAVVGCRSARRTVRVCRCGFSRVVVRSASAQSSSVRVR